MGERRANSQFVVTRDELTHIAVSHTMHMAIKVYAQRKHITVVGATERLLQNALRDEIENDSR